MRTISITPTRLFAAGVVVGASLLFAMWYAKVTFEPQKQHFDAPLDKIEITRLQQKSSATRGTVVNPDLGNFPCVRSKTGVCLRSFNDTESDGFGCIDLKTATGPTPICINDPKTDKYVSSFLSNSGSWEDEFRADLSKLFQSDPSLALLDLGCNVGTHTLTIAKLGRQVVAIDPSVKNLRQLARALTLGKLHQHVTLLWNAISNSHEAVFLRIPDDNASGSQIHSRHTIGPEEGGNIVETIELDDLIGLFRGKKVFVKMDIEGEEANALQGGELFFEEINVPYILTEFNMHVDSRSGPQIIDFLTKRHYEPYGGLTTDQKLDIENFKQWPKDIIWHKRNP